MSIVKSLFLPAVACALAACGTLSCASQVQSTPIASQNDAAGGGDYQDAVMLMHASRYSEAVDVSTRLMEAHGVSAAGLTVRGVSYAKLKKASLSFKDLLEATKISYSVETLLNLGNALRSFGYCARAADAYRHALILNGDNPKILINLSSAYACMGELDMANQMFARAIPHIQKDAVVYTVAATLKALGGALDEALVATDAAIARDASYWPAYGIRKRILDQLGRTQEAAETAKRYNELKGRKMYTITRPRKLAGQ